jgi:Neuraminidase (sialidase)
MCAPPGGAPVRVSPAGDLPFGPYVTGVAVAAAGDGSVTAAWIDTLTGSRDGSGLDAIWSARSTDGGTTWSAPVPAARARPLPHLFPGDTFRNVPLLSLAAGAGGRLYLAYAAEEPGRGADIRLVRSDDAGAHWGDPVTVDQDTGAADQFQPSVSATRRQVVVSFLDRRLDPAGTFADEWLARSRDGGATWSETRLSQQSWDPALGAPHSPTGDLLGDHQALVSRGCTTVALAADPRERARPQLFAWTLSGC